MTEERLSDLLAHRDGERLHPDVAYRIEADVDARAELAVLRQLKHELNELPAVLPPPDTWANIQARAGRGRGRNALARLTGHFPLATAATVFLAALIGIVAWDPADLRSVDRAPATAAVDLSSPESARFAALVSRSQQLESSILNRGAAWSPEQEALLLRIADLDAELSSTTEGAPKTAAERDALWQQRVTLLELLAASRRASVQSAVF